MIDLSSKNCQAQTLVLDEINSPFGLGVDAGWVGPAAGRPSNTGLGLWDHIDQLAP